MGKKVFQPNILQITTDNTAIFNKKYNHFLYKGSLRKGRDSKNGIHTYLRKLEVLYSDH